MKRFLFFSIALIFIINAVFPLTVTAYSYGDPNEEKVAEVYKNMKIKLNENPPNYDATKALFETVKEELDMHMGLEPAQTIINDIEEKDKDKIITDMEKILVLNIARRLESVEKNFKEFDVNKKLIAKAFATYDALSPNIQEKDKTIDQQIRNNFDTLLISLGNPGLFGVGEKAPDIAVFKQTKEVVFDDLQQQFNLKDLQVGHFSASNAEATETTDLGKKDWTDLSNLKNWIPIMLILAAIIGIIIYTVKRKK